MTTRVLLEILDRRGRPSVRQILSFDGETAVFVVRRDGPRVIDVPAVMAAAAHQGVFVGQFPRT